MEILPIFRIAYTENYGVSLGHAHREFAGDALVAARRLHQR